MEVVHELLHAPHRVEGPLVVRAAFVEEAVGQAGADAIGHGQRLRDDRRVALVPQADRSQAQRRPEHRAVVGEVRRELEHPVRDPRRHPRHVAQHLLADHAALAVGGVVEEEVVAEGEGPEPHARVRFVVVDVPGVRDVAGDPPPDGGDGRVGRLLDERDEPQVGHRLDAVPGSGPVHAGEELVVPVGLALDERVGRVVGPAVEHLGAKSGQVGRQEE